VEKVGIWLFSFCAFGIMGGFLSIPLHEICHWAFLKLSGCRSPLRITLIDIKFELQEGVFRLNVSGNVTNNVKYLRTIHCPDYLARYFVTYDSLISFSGGSGVFFIYMLMAIWLFPGYSATSCAFILIGIEHLIYAFREMDEDKKRYKISLKRKMGFYFIVSNQSFIKRPKPSQATQKPTPRSRLFPCNFIF